MVFYKIVLGSRFWLNLEFLRTAGFVKTWSLANKTGYFTVTHWSTKCIGAQTCIVWWETSRSYEKTLRLQGLGIQAPKHLKRLSREDIRHQQYLWCSSVLVYSTSVAEPSTFWSAPEPNLAPDLRTNKLKWTKYLKNTALDPAKKAWQRDTWKKGVIFLYPHILV